MMQMKHRRYTSTGWTRDEQNMALKKKIVSGPKKIEKWPGHQGFFF